VVIRSRIPIPDHFPLPSPLPNRILEDVLALFVFTCVVGHPVLRHVTRYATARPLMSNTAADRVVWTRKLARFGRRQPDRRVRLQTHNEWHSGVVSDRSTTRRSVIALLHRRRHIIAVVVRYCFRATHGGAIGFAKQEEPRPTPNPPKHWLVAPYSAVGYTINWTLKLEFNISWK